MCAVCEKTVGMSPKVALVYLGERMKLGAKQRACIDQLIGKLIGVEDNEPDRDADGDWERAKG